MINNRPRFDAALEELKEIVIQMAETASFAFTQSMKSLVTQDLDLAETVITEDKVINRIERDINEKVITIITKQQPVAKDLRRIMAAVKVASDIERIGDLAVNIAKSTKFIGTATHIKNLETLPHMADITMEMLDNSVQAFIEEDMEKAQSIGKTDDQVDELFGEVVKDLMHLMTQRPDEIGQITQLAFIARYIERAGDHITNIAENIIFIVSGKHVDLD